VEVHLIAVGKLRACYRAACDDYLRRLSRYGTVTEREVRDSSRLEAALPARATIILLDRGGTGWTSEELATRLDAWRLAAAPLALVIGGPTGHPPEVARRAAQKWSLGPLTLPHELARVVVLEQWYRAWTILRGEPYHKGS
jgi:23S rRNA (pseudouridine1915-N3)-methyltransferase